MSDVKTPAFIWDNQYKTGVPEMDCEHIMLFSLYNQLCAIIETGKHDYALEDTINAAMTYTRMHFGHEENYLKRVGYPGLEDHKKEHREIIQRMNRLYDSFEDNGAYAVAHDFKSLMFSWLAGHVLKDDQAYRPEKEE